MPHRQHNFARTTAVLDQMGLNIVDARITPPDGGFSLDTYLVLEDTGTPIADRAPRARDRTAAVERAAAAGGPRRWPSSGARRAGRMF